jgi:hypothetical protein
MRLTKSARCLVVVAAIWATACKKDDDADDAAHDTGIDEGDLPAGSTAIVVVLNPVVNAGHATGTPSIVGDARDAVRVEASPGTEDLTDATGLGVVGAAPGPTVVLLGEAEEPAEVALDVIAEGDVYDAAVGYDGVAGEYFELTPIRYAVGEPSGAIYIEPDTAIGDIESTLESDDVIVVLRPGTYIGDLTIRGRGVLLFGEGFSESSVVIEGSVAVMGEAVRLRGLTIAGDVTSAGNNFGMSFSEVRGSASITGNGGAFLRNVFCGQVSIPTDNAALLDNYGLEPLTSLPEGACEIGEGETGG